MVTFEDARTMIDHAREFLREAERVAASPG
jgi:hypothetical protein